jgi:hypothetical protein
LSTLSRVHRLRTADRIFFVTVNLRRSLPALTALEFASSLKTLQPSSDRLHQSPRRA